MFKEAIKPVGITIAVLVILFFMMWVPDADAQQQVKCRNIMHPDVVQIFPGWRCPRGWTPIGPA